MTENLAARGEGLAGLMAELESMTFLKAAWHCPQCRTYGENEIRDFVGRWKAALEAAAPAGTAAYALPGDAEALAEVFWHGRKLELSVIEWAQERLENTKRLAAQKDGADREGWLEDGHYWALIVAALATPSPQAPAEQRYENAIEQDWMETWFANAIMAGYDHARGGSPRKVGEDGALAKEIAADLEDAGLVEPGLCGIKAMEIIARRLSLSSPIEPTEMRICEINHLVLHPNQTYRFTVDVNCKECVAYVAARPTSQASSEIREALTVEEVVACLWTRSDGSPDPAATTSRLNNLLRKRALAPSRQGAGGK